MSLATIGCGRWWLAALAAFLLRGGIVVVVLPIVFLPTPAQLALVFLDPTITGAGVGTMGPGLVRLVAGLVIALACLVLVTGLVGAWLDARLVEAIAADNLIADDEVAAPARPPHRVPVSRGLVVRLAAHVPTLAAASLGLVILGRALYDELLTPSGPGLLAARVVARAPLATTAMLGCWIVGEAWGGLAQRRLALGDSTAVALREGLCALFRPSGLATLALATLVVGGPLAAIWLAGGAAFQALWPLLVDGAAASRTVPALVAFVASWLAGLWLLAIGLAWRAAAWTAEVLRRA